MIAEELAAALRLEQQMAEIDRCPREPDFRALYQARGDELRQDDIRRRNPDVRHCRFLIATPDACDCLPRAIGEARQGQPCPNNPYCGPHVADLDELERYRPLLDAAGHLGDLAQLGLLPGRDEIEPGEIMAARIISNYRKGQEIQTRMVMPLMGGPGDMQQ